MSKRNKKYSFFFRNGLTLVFLGLFLVTLIAQALTGWKDNNQELLDKGAIP